MSTGRRYEISLGGGTLPVGWQSDLATPKQLCRLRYLGVPFSEPLSKGRAGLLIDQTELDASLALRLEQWHRDKYRLHPDLYPSEDVLPFPEADTPDRRKSALWLLWPLGAVAIIVFTVVPGLRFWEHATRVAPQPVAATQQVVVPPAPTRLPLPLPARESRLRAIQKHPALAEPGSSFNARFVLAYRRLEAAHSPRLQDPNWPELLADECAARQ